MKLADRVIDAHSSGVRSASGFTIAQTSKMFKILSDSLYSDKVMAVIRELSTNAYDSHISAGNKNPFKVTLPTAANPTFSVRDYGTGLSQEDMENLYTTYGASNKNDSNDFVGCLGLGSKSPFAYTKSFTTSSYFNGKKYTYVASIDDSGVPALNLFNISDTDEANGLEISFAVKQYDFNEFSSKAIRIFHYFKMKPIIEGGVNTSLKDHAYSNKNIIISGDGWRVCRLSNDTNKFPNTHHHIDSGVVALMGNIAYPVVVSQLIGEQKAEQADHIQKWNRAFGKADIDNWKNFVSEILNQSLYLELDFGIGELEMDVSREGLQYTKDVIKALRNKTQEIYMEMKEEFSKKIAGAKTKVEAIQTYYTMNDLAGGWGVGATWTDSKGKAHDINTGKDLEYKFGASKNLYAINYRTAGYRSRRMVYLTNSIHINTLTGKGEYYYSGHRKTGKLTFFVCDVKSEETAKKIAIRYCNDNDCFAYLMIDSKNISDSDNGFEDLIADIGADNIVKISEFKDLIKSNSPRKNSNRSGNGRVSDQDVFFIYGSSKDSGSISNPYNDARYLKTLTQDELDSFDEEDYIVYVPILRYQSDSAFTSELLPDISSINNLLTNEILSSLIKDMMGNTKVYAIKSSTAKTLKDEKNLVLFNDFLKDKLKSVVKERFEDVSSYNTIVEFCRKEFNDKDKNHSHWYNEGDIVHQFCYHMLNIFGIEYKKFIKNKDMVKTIDSYLIMDYFVNTVHMNKYDISMFKSEDYFKHINDLLSEIGISTINSKTIRSTNIEYNTLISALMVMYETSENVDHYTKLFKSDTNKTKHGLDKLSDLRKTLKTEIDNNPMVKYIMGTHRVNGQLRELSNKNPISNLSNTNRHYYGNNNDWLSQMSDNNIDLLRIQLSSLIK
jgi:hypothetical protein